MSHKSSSNIQILSNSKKSLQQHKYRLSSREELSRMPRPYHKSADFRFSPDTLDVKKSMKQVTPFDLSPVFPKEDSQDSSLLKLIQLIQVQQKFRKQTENLVLSCEESSGFKTTLAKSSEVLNHIAKENKGTDKLTIVNKVIDFEKDLFKNIKRQVTLIKLHKSQQKLIFEYRAKIQQLEEDKNVLNNEVEALKAHIKAKRNNDSYFKELQIIWRKEKTEFELKLSALENELKIAKEKKAIYISNKDNHNAYLVKQLKQKKYELRGIITRLQYELGEAKENLIKRDKFILELQEKLDYSLKVIFENEKRELLRSFTERSSMLIEEIRHLFVYKDKYFEKTFRLKSLKKKLVYYEEAERLANAGQNLRSENRININDPIFCCFSTKRPSFRAFPKPENSYKLLKPSFASFFEISNTRVYEYRPQFSLWLEVTTRAILDAKFSELFLVLPFSFPASFPEFVYEWLGKFYIEEDTRSVREIEWWKKEYIEENKLMLLGALSESKCKKIWEVHTFKEFLTEELTIDELVFYLHSRHLLFEGPQMAHFEGKFYQFHYVKLEKVYEVLETQMVHLNSECLEKLKAMLRKRSKPKDKEHLVESSMCLRVLLEYYRSEKQVKIESISIAYNKCCSNENPLIFEDFLQIVKSINENIKEEEIARLYRQVFAIGNSKFSLEALITTFNEFGVFYREIYTKRKDFKMSLIDDSKYRFKACNKQVTSLGIPIASSIFDRLERLVNKGKEISDSFDNWRDLTQVVSVFYEIGILPKDQEWESALVHLVNVFLEGIKKKQLKDIVVNMSARKIQGWYRKAKVSENSSQTEENKKPKRKKVLD